MGIGFKIGVGELEMPDELGNRLKSIKIQSFFFGSIMHYQTYEFYEKKEGD